MGTRVSYPVEIKQRAVKGKGITMSMSRKGTPADNAAIESFHFILKSETFYLNNIVRTTAIIVERTSKTTFNMITTFVFKRN